MKKNSKARLDLALYSDAYDPNADLGFFDLQIYAFNVRSNYFPDPYVGYKIQVANSKYLTLLKDGSRSIGNLVKSDNQEPEKDLLLCYGGSVMFGCYSASDSRTIPGCLAKLESVTNKFEIKNYGLPGGTILQNFSHFFNYAYPSLRPGRQFQLVFLFGFNEYRALYHYGLRSSESIVGPFQALLGNTRVARIISKQKRARDINAHRLSSAPDIELGFLINQMNVFAKLVSELGGKVNFVFQPTLLRSKKVRHGLENTYQNPKETEFNSFVERFSHEISEHHNFIDLSDIFNQIPSQIFIDDVHMGCKGNRLLADSLVKNGIIE